MSEEKANDVVPAMLAEGEAVIPAEKAEEFKAVVEEILAEKAAEEALVEEEKKPEVEAPAVEAEKPVHAEESKKPAENVVSSKSVNAVKPSNVAPGITSVNNGVIGTGDVKLTKTEKKAPKVPKEEKVAVHSTRNVTWPNVGKVFRGYNIVTKEQADKWLTRDHVRLATPEEVAQEFGK